ncbi:type I restriction-modification system subunit M [Desulfonema magnum]|uniref:site-specific DNA-methyltransferase (adenine-specific) n=1 Tax=Desulfonema magnum TaxID=45655 RepID=A0A975BEU1_9BACT|nr:class I SAM-dependent DNA methyltransferase [Desulfonema magnum]QTA84217.1 SAM-dependent DNA methylase [Desulfonema magnum]
MQDITKLENDLWEAADQLRANSKLTASEYSMPVLGLIFLRHAFNRFKTVKEKIEANLPSRGGRKRRIIKADFEKENAIFLPENARFDFLAELPEDETPGKAINDAMKIIEEEYENLKGALPKNYTIFEDDLLQELLRIFNREALQTAAGDVFGRIYEYFLNKFAMTGAQEGGEFFTPISLVQTIVNVIEPDHGIVFDPACGSGGMFVQTGYFIESKGENTQKKVTFFGQEKAETNTRLAMMNLAVHGLEINISQENTFYGDHYELTGKCDFVMANPPFNVDGVDAKKVKNDPRLPFGLPGMNKKTKALSNANYLWIQYFYSYLNEKGRAGFVMASSASDAGHSDKLIREKLVNTGHADVIISIGTNFFYTRSLPCTLWFFDKGKSEDLQDKVLMIDARNIYRKVTRKINDFTPEQLKNITSVVWLYRGESDKYLKLIQEYLDAYNANASEIKGKIQAFETCADAIGEKLAAYYDLKCGDGLGAIFNKKLCDAYHEKLGALRSDYKSYQKEGKTLIQAITRYNEWFSKNQPDFSGKIKSVNDQQHKIYKRFQPVSDKIRALGKNTDHVYKLNTRVAEYAEKEMGSRKDADWNNKEMTQLLKDLDRLRKKAIESLKGTLYFYKQVIRLQSRFPDARFADVEGLCKQVDRSEIEENDWSLTPGRYVGVAVQEEEDFDFEERLREIHVEIEGLNEEAVVLAEMIRSDFEALMG